MTEEPTAPEDREPDVEQNPEPPRPTTLVRTERPNIGPTRLPDNGDVSQWSPAQRAIVDAAGLVFTFPDWHARDGERVPAPAAVVERFLAVCRATGLNPLARQIYAIPRLSKGTVEWSIQTGIDGFRVVAERTKLYRGRDPFLWMTDQGEWVEAFIPKFHGDHPLAARASVWREGWDRPTVAIAEWEAYKQTTSKGDLTAMWKKQGPGQLAKCAEALALRTAFPQDLSGIYTDDETAGPQSAIDQDRAEESGASEAEARMLAKIDEAVDIDRVRYLRGQATQLNSPPTVFAALLAREAVLRSDSRNDEDGDLQGTEPAKPTVSPVRIFDASAMTGKTAEPDDDRDPEILAHEARLAAQEAAEQEIIANEIARPETETEAMQ